MKKFLMSLMLLYPVLLLQAQEIDQKNYTKLGTIKDLTIRSVTGPDVEGPFSYWISGREIMTWDRYGDRIVVFDRNLKPIKSIGFDQTSVPNELGFSILVSNKKIVLGTVPFRLYILDPNSFRPLSQPIKFPQSMINSRDNYNFVSVTSNLVIIEDHENFSYSSFRLPNDPDKEAEYLDPAKTKKAIMALGEGNSGLHFDEKGFLWNGDVLMTRSASTFSRYVFKDNSPRNRPELPLAAPFLGLDKQGNYYWGGTKYFFGFSKDFTFLKKFMINIEYDESKVGPIPFLDEDGNIYGFTLDTSWRIVDVYFLKRDW